MLKQYIQNLQSKSPHQQRGHAVHLAGIATAIVFFVWITALGVRFSLSAAGPTKEASNDNATLNPANADQSQLANVVSAAPGVAGAPVDSVNSGNMLVVATSTQ